MKTFCDAKCKRFDWGFWQILAFPVLVDVVNKITTLLERSGDVYFLLCLEWFNEPDNIWVSAWCHHSCFVVVLRTIALLQCLFVNDLHCLLRPGYFVSRKFDWTYRCSLQWFWCKLILIDLIWEPLGFQKIGDPALLVPSWLEVKLATTFYWWIVVQFNWVQPLMSLWVLF